MRESTRKNCKVSSRPTRALDGRATIGVSGDAPPHKRECSTRLGSPLTFLGELQIELSKAGLAELRGDQHCEPAEERPCGYLGLLSGRGRDTVASGLRILP